MATIDTLCKRDPPGLVPITIHLRRNEFEDRYIWGTPDFWDWVQNDLPKLQPGRLGVDQSPQEQFFEILYKWITGKPMRYNKMFKDLMPRSDEVWELKTADLRIFGWLYRPRKFIAVVGGYADDYKGAHNKQNYEDAKRKVLRCRCSLDLDEPKYVTGVFDDLV